MLGAHTEKKVIIEAFHWHISWPVIRKDWDKNVYNRKPDRLRYPSQKSQLSNIRQKEKKNMQTNNVTMGVEMTTKPVAQLN